MENTPENFQPENNVNKGTVEQQPQQQKPQPHKKKRKDFINNSGQGDVPVVKVVTDKFNWGAFLFTWIWGIHYKKWITLLIIPGCFIPLVGLGLSIWFGIEGNKWAWQSKRYKSIKEFHEIQKKWATVGAWLVIISTVLTIVSYAMMFSMLMKQGFTPEMMMQLQQ